MSAEFVCVFVLLLSSLSSAAEYKFTDCSHKEVTKVQVDGCAGSSHTSCPMVKGKDFTLQIDFTANQDADKVEFKFTANIGGIEIPVPGTDPNGCNGVKCPLVKGQSYSFKFHMVVPKLLPNIQTVVGAQLVGNNGPLACIQIDGSVQD